LSHKRPVNLFDLFILLIVFISYASISLLVLNNFDPFWAVSIGFALTAVTFKLFRIKIRLRLTEIPTPLLFVLLISLAFRAQPYLYVPGGGDEGVYVNMSVAYEQNGSTFVIDDVRKKAIESGLKEFYDSANQIGTKIVKERAYEGAHLPGIYIKDLSQSEYVFQFYPLHPLWMAIAGKFAGRDNRVYSLVFFSLLSIVAFYLLARELSGGNKISSVMVSLFLALNPLHAFFSKFPVTEVVTLAFSSLAFFYLARYYNDFLAGETKPFYLILSSALLGCMFFTRISGFIYMPFFYFLALFTILFEENQTSRRQLILYFLSIFALYAVSVGYGMIYSYPYSHDIYNIWFARFFHSSWEIKLIVTLITASLSLGFVWLFRKQIGNLFHRNIFLSLKPHLNGIFCFAFGLIIAIAFYKAYLLAFTDKYVGTGWDTAGIGAQWKIAGLGLSSLNYSNIFVAIWYLSPFGFAILVYSIFWIFPRKRAVVWTVFIVFLCLFWFAFTIIKFYTQFQFFYARYLLSELVPYSLLATSLALGYLFQKGKWWKTASLCLGAFIAIYFLYFTCHQFKGKSADGAHSALKNVAGVMGKKDLLLLYDIHSPLFLQTPLSLFYGLNTCYLTKPGKLASSQGKSFLAKFNRVFFLTPRPLHVSFLVPINRIQYKQGEFLNSSFIPTEYHYIYSNLYLYKVLD